MRINGIPEQSPIPEQSVWDQACRLRQTYWGKQVFLRGIVEFSNHCRQNCLYCGLRRDNTRLSRYRLDHEIILRCVSQIQALGIGTVVLQSGEDPHYSGSELARLIEKIKQRGLAVTLSLGSRTPEEYRLWREAGADRYLLKFETADAARYAALRPECSLNERLDCLHILKDLDYETGSGMIVGLPGEMPRILQKAYSLLERLHPDMISVSPFVPHPDTPLGKHPPCPTEHALDAMALARVKLPESHMPVTSALSLRGEGVRLRALEVGDVLMPSLTPESVRAAYTIYPGKNEHEDSPQTRARAIRNELLAAGFTLPPGPGGAWRVMKDAT